SVASRRHVHLLRSRVDAIMVGIGTALADDPVLTARLPHLKRPPRIATRVIMDRECQLPLTCQLVRTATMFPVLLLHGKQLKPMALARRQRLLQAGVEMLALDVDSHGRLNLHSALKELGHRGMTNVLVEGGPRLMASLLADHLADEIHVYIAPVILGDAQARHAVEGQIVRRLTHAKPAEIITMQRFGPDVHIVLRPPASLPSAT
ncbi:MAG: RibD family protein, partial [Phycisphaerae bacterium]|nr:RibD family protein [Phycisphaerae bacterium]